MSPGFLTSSAFARLRVCVCAAVCARQSTGGGRNRECVAHRRRAVSPQTARLHCGWGGGGVGGAAFASCIAWTNVFLASLEVQSAAPEFVADQMPQNPAGN